MRWACLAAIAMLASAARADIQQPPNATGKGERQLQRKGVQPPTPAPAHAEVKPGGRVEIQLTATGALGKTVEFIIRSRPELGTLDGPHQLTRESALVVYTQRAESGSGHDTFTYAVQANGTAVSAPEVVDIDVAEPPPELVASPAELDFGAVNTGDSSGAQITLQNRGGGVAVGHLDVPVPWVVEGESAYRILRGASQTFRVVFRPRVGGAVNEVWRGAGSSAGAVRLVGTGLATPAPASAHPIAVALNDEAAPQTPVPPPVATAVETPAPSPLPLPAPMVQATPNLPITLPPAETPAALPTLALMNQAKVEKIQILAVGKSTIDLSWPPPVPLPASYRVEMRYLKYDEAAPDHLRIEWRPYPAVDVQARTDKVSVHVSKLPADTAIVLRILSVDQSGQLSPPSSALRCITRPSAGWWHFSLFNLLVVALFIVAALMVRAKLGVRREIRAMDERRARALAD